LLYWYKSTNTDTVRRQREAADTELCALDARLRQELDEVKRSASESEKVLNAKLVQCNIDLKRFQGTRDKLRALRFFLARARALSPLSSRALSLSLSTAS
jgi:hypothetical protein